MTIGLSGPLPRVKPDVFIGVLWAEVSVTGVFLIARGYARISTFGRLMLDDYFVLLAWLLYLITACVWNSQAMVGWEAEMFAGGQPVKGYILDFDAIVRWAHWSLAGLVLYYLIIYSIKASFLIFFWRLGDRVNRYKIHWWFVTVFTILSWGTSFGTKPWYCFTNITPSKMNWCLSPPESHHDYIYLYIDLTFSLVTDILIVSLPLNILWKVKISFRQKLALGGVFLLTLLTMLFDIIRVTTLSIDYERIDQMWLHFLGSITSGIAIIVACLVSFRVFFTKTADSSSHRPPWLKGSRIRAVFPSTKTWFSTTFSNYTRTYSHQSGRLGRPATLNTEKDTISSSRETSVLGGIYVSKSFTTISRPSNAYLRDVRDGVLLIV